MLEFRSKTRGQLSPFGAAVLIICLSGCRGVGVALKPAIEGNGKITTATRDIEDYSSIDVHDAIELQWSPSDATAFEVTVDGNLAPMLVTKVERGKLKIYFTDPVAPSQTVIVKTSSKALNAIYGQGATKILLVDVSSETFNVELSGSSDCRAKGVIGHLSANASGASRFEGSELTSQSATLELSGSAKFDITTTDLKRVNGSGAGRLNALNINSSSLQLELSGSCRCELSGQVERLKIEASGAARLVARQLDVDTANINMSGAAKAEVGLVDAIMGEASGAARLTHEGKADNDVRTSGAARVSS